MSPKDFSGKVVLITGAASGIGLATAVNFSKLGANLALVDRHSENLKKTQQKCSDSQVLLITADLTKEDDVQRIVEKTIQEFGKLHVLINCAGIGCGNFLETLKMEDFDEIMNTNIRAIVQLTKLAVPHLKATKGNIVNVSSVAGLRAVQYLLAYGMAKSALDQFTRSICLELAPYQIRVNSVNPGVINTKIYNNAGMTDQEVETYFEEIGREYPLGRIGGPEEVADAIIFLASEKAAFITGAILPITGGAHIA